MRRADAPPPGWYPDPTGGSGLLWWDGLDWTRHHRPPPAHLDDRDTRAATGQHGGSDTGTGDVGGITTATQLRSRTAERAARRAEERLGEQQLAASVAEARRVAQAEVERAVKDATSQLAATRDRYLPRLDDIRMRFRRWTRLVVITVLVLVALSTWANATLQVGLLEWLGERIDAFTAIVIVTTSIWPPG